MAPVVTLESVRSLDGAQHPHLQILVVIEPNLGEEFTEEVQDNWVRKIIALNMDSNLSIDHQGNGFIIVAELKKGVDPQDYVEELRKIL